MKKAILCFLALIMVLGLIACGKKEKEPTWQEQYDLGVKYLSEGNYKEAIIAFTAAIEIDPKQALAYVGRGDAYMGGGDAYVGSDDAHAGGGTPETLAENLAAAKADYQAALDLDKTIAEAWLGLVDAQIMQEDYEGAAQVLEEALAVIESEKVKEKLLEKQEEIQETIQKKQAEDWLAQIDDCIAQEDYEEAKRLLEEALAMVDSEELREKLLAKQEELEQLATPEPGSEEFLWTAAQHLNPAINFDFAVNGTPLAGSDIYAIASAVGGQVENMQGDLCVWTGPISVNKFSWSSMDGVDRIALLDVLGEKEAVSIWPSEYFAGIVVTDTLSQALEKLGFTEEERAYLENCTNIDLHYYPDNTTSPWKLDVLPAGAEGRLPGQCSLNFYCLDKCSYCFEYTMDNAGLGYDTPVDGRAELDTMVVNNLKKQ